MSAKRQYSICMHSFSTKKKGKKQPVYSFFYSSFFFTLQHQPVRPREIISYSITGTRIDCKLCPSDSDLIAFIHDKNIWVTNVQTSEDTQLTYAHTGRRPLLSHQICIWINEPWLKKTLKWVKWESVAQLVCVCNLSSLSPLQYGCMRVTWWMM